ncbi:3-phosphoinositide-dependent protein kinase 1 [Hibiscus syriacus]|uniref:3-phosphoinositide-dependent protein kinase 1 n=1 Tax=Hibiscus syriacus TaxID=106335 RepID=A0A6A2YZC3_HIBSY|nr:3-phosphoinositide-dependent protein kinase 1 [Hibiscus syriacus]
MLDMQVQETDDNSKDNSSNNVQRSKSFAFRAPQENFSIQDFELGLDPGKISGAGPDGYAELKMHPFYRGVDWSSLRAKTPPKLALETGAQSSEGGDDYNDSSWNPTYIGDVSATVKLDFSTPTQRSLNVCRFFPSANLSRQQFLDPGELVLMISMMKKLQKLSSKEVQLILTNKPKLIYVDPSKLVVKGDIIWSDNSDDLGVQVTSPSHFKICTPKKVLSFDDSKQRARQWKKVIEVKGILLALSTVFIGLFDAAGEPGNLKPI